MTQLQETYLDPAFRDHSDARGVFSQDEALRNANRMKLAVENDIAANTDTLTHRASIMSPVERATFRGRIEEQRNQYRKLIAMTEKNTVLLA